MSITAIIDGALSATPLRVGDSVRIVGESISGIDFTGRVGVLIENTRRDLYPFTVRVDGEKALRCFHYGQLQRIEPAPAEPAAAEPQYIAGEVVTASPYPLGHHRGAIVKRAGKEWEWLVLLEGEANPRSVHRDLIRPCTAVPGCAVRHRRSGEIGLLTVGGWITDGANGAKHYRAADWAVIALPADAPVSEPAPVPLTAGMIVETTREFGLIPAGAITTIVYYNPDIGCKVQWALKHEWFPAKYLRPAAATQTAAARLRDVAEFPLSANLRMVLREVCRALADMPPDATAAEAAISNADYRRGYNAGIIAAQEVVLKAVQG